ncbi:MAG TPA: hypothetical protein VFV87_01070, partial [Pirellulaceae bacterium]|nr:hypothetical protein [Pirellulaceae bacterium]
MNRSRTPFVLAIANLILAMVFGLCPSSGAIAAEPLRIATFEADITPPLGSPLCDALVQPARTIDDPLLARGIVLFPEGEPIVLCALDWVGIGNSGYDAFREALANAAGTKAERVAVHCLHQHDAPGCDFAADDLLKPLGLNNELFNAAFAREAMQRIASAVSKACQSPQPVTHISLGKAKVEQVASARRVMG